MRIGDASLSFLQSALREAGVRLDFGLARVKVRADYPELASTLRLLYAHFPMEPAEGFFDVTASLERVGGLRRLARAQVRFVVDGREPFEPFPADTDLPLLEWGLNWCIAERCHHHLLLHAGVVERNGRAIVLPALPGSGKSTLTAALASRGWRFLADEFGAVRLSDSMLMPVVRPSGLKNQSIGVIRAFAPDAVIGPSYAKTRKGTVAHLAPSAASVAARHVPAFPMAVVFPKYVPGASLSLEPMPRARAFAKLAANSFNYEVLGPLAFRAMGRLIERCKCYQLTYSSLEEALPALARIHAEVVMNEHSYCGAEAGGL